MGSLQCIIELILLVADLRNFQKYFTNFIPFSLEIKNVLKIWLFENPNSKENRHKQNGGYYRMGHGKL
jgi:hypothetical protein